MLTITNVKKKYGQKTVFADVNLRLSAGKIVAITGINGCGKSTLFKAILGLINFGGEISKGGKFANGIIETPCFFPNFTGEENIRAFLPATKIDKHKLHELAVAFSLQDDLDIAVKKYSLGMKQKLAIIYVLLSNPDILLFDEPTNALDQKALAVFRKLLLAEKENGKLIILSSHDYGYIVGLADEIYEFQNGGIVLNKTLVNTNDSISYSFQLSDIKGGIAAAQENGCEFEIVKDGIIVKNWYLPLERLLLLFVPFGIKTYSQVQGKERRKC